MSFVNKSGYDIDIKDYDLIDIESVVIYGSDLTYDIEVVGPHRFEARNPRCNFSSISHNSASLCMFDVDDEQMITAKIGNWFVSNPQRGRSNNSAVLHKEYTTKEQFENLISKTKQFGEPGFVWVDDYDITYNPCVTGDTIINTDKGLRKAIDLLNKPFKAIVDGKLYDSKGFFKTGEKSVFELKTSKGYSVNVTEDHKILIKDSKTTKWVEAKDLKFGDELILSNNEEYKIDIDKKSKDYKLGYLTGNIVGDGSFSSEYALIRFWGSDVIDYINIAKEYIKDLFDKEVSHTLSKDRYTIQSSLVRDNIENVIEYNTKKFKDAILLKSDDFLIGLLSGYFDADGTIYGSLDSKGTAIRLTSNDVEKLQYIQIILNRFGILTSIYKRREAQDTLFPDGNGGKKTYKTKTVYELHLSGKAIDIFAKYDIFQNKKKRERLNKICSSRIRAPNKQKITTKFESLAYKGIEAVYDCTVEDIHRFDANGMIVHNCVEAGMYPLIEVDGKMESGFQMCNLSNINGSLVYKEEDFYDACIGASILGTLQAGYTNFKYLSPESKQIIEREALIGVGVAGWMNSPDVLLNADVQNAGATKVKEINKKLANILDINQSARCTVVKPDGNSGVLLQSGSGIHGEHAKKYFRHVQMNKESDIAKLLLKYNPAMVEDSVWSANNADYCIAFPSIAREGSKYKDDLLGVKQLEIVKLVQNNWIETGTNVHLCVNPLVRHNVSNTVTVDNWDEVSDYIYENRHFLAGVSLINGSGDKDYNQAPNTEVLDEEQIIQKYGVASMFASGLIVSAIDSFSDLWIAIQTAQGYGLDISIESHENMRKRDWARRFVKFASNYFDGDLKQTEYCLKDVYLLHKWIKIQRTLIDIDFEKENMNQKEIDADTLASAACTGSAEGCFV